MDKNKIFIAVIIILIAAGVVAYKNSRSNTGRSSDATIKIGALLPLTGAFAAYGEDTQNGLQLAQQEIEQRTGWKVDLIIEDSASDPKVAAQAANKFINVERVPAVIAGSGSSSNLAVAPLMEQAKVPYIVISSTPKLNEAGKYVFKVHPDIQGEVIRMLQYMVRHEVKKVAVVYDQSSDTQIVAKDEFLSRAREAGLEILASEGLDGRATSDFRTVLTKATSSQPQALYLLLNDRAGANTVNQSRDMGLKQQFFGWASLESGVFLGTAGSAAEGTIFTGQPFSCDSGTEAMAMYCRQYKEKFAGRLPTQYGAHAYHVLQLLIKVIQENSLADKLNDIAGRDLIVENLLKTRNYQGVSGELTFDSEGNVHDKDFVLRIVKDGKFVKLEE
jgi:branched-chain amino acid transport system substrate-binding protein